MPLTLLDAHGPYALPTGWHEVTTAQYCAFAAASGFDTVEARASFFAGRPIQVNGYVADCLAFLLSAPSAEGGLPYPADLGSETYLQAESIRELLEQPLHQCFGLVYGYFTAAIRQRLLPTMVAVFSQQLAERIAARCLVLPISETYPAVAHCLAELQRLNGKYKALGEPDHTEAGRRLRAAGADRLLVFKHLNVARHYAQQFGTTIDVVYMRSWEEIALLLLQDRTQAEITDKLQQQQSHDKGGN